MAVALIAMLLAAPAVLGHPPAPVDEGVIGGCSPGEPPPSPSPLPV